MEIAKGVHLIETYANCVIFTDNRLVLIDTSVDDTAKDILNWLRKNGRAPGDLTSVVVTHIHPDHVLGLKSVKSRAPNTKIAAHKDDADYVDRTKVYPWHPPQRHEAVTVDIRLEDGQKYEGFLVIHTPGHTPGSMALLDTERKVLVAGDSLNNEKGLAPMSDKFNFDPAAHRKSIKKLANYEFETILVGHGGPILRGGSQQVKALAAKLS